MSCRLNKYRKLSKQDKAKYILEIARNYSWFYNSYTRAESTAFKAMYEEKYLIELNLLKLLLQEES